MSCLQRRPPSHGCCHVVGAADHVDRRRNGASGVLGPFRHERWGTEPWLVAVGALFADLQMSMLHLLRLTKQDGREAVRQNTGAGKDRGEK